jgi:hypothetical protein
MTHENTYRDDKLEGKSLFFVYIANDQQMSLIITLP